MTEEYKSAKPIVDLWMHKITHLGSRDLEKDAEDLLENYLSENYGNPIEPDSDGTELIELVSIWEDMSLKARQVLKQSAISLSRKYPKD